jgi:hypothetical protein
MVQIGQFPHGKLEAPVVVFSPTAKHFRPSVPAMRQKPRRSVNATTAENYWRFSDQNPPIKL